MTRQLDPDAFRAYHRTLHARVETAAPGAEFVIYRMVGGEPLVLTNIQVIDLSGDDMGLSSEILDITTGDKMYVDYSPKQLFDYPIFVALPLHCRVHWRSIPEDVGSSGTLTWPLYIRTGSRVHLREVGVIYCEAAADFSREFSNNAGW